MPEDEIFDDEYMNEMLLNPDLYGLEDEEEITELDKKISDLSNEAQKITDDANKELEEYKDKLIDESEGAAFFLEDDEYEIIKNLS